MAPGDVLFVRGSGRLSEIGWHCLGSVCVCARL